MKTSNPGRKSGLVRRAVFCAEPLQRTNFFAGRLLTAQDLIAEQEYHREKQRRHNLHCHGYGVVDGLKISIARGRSRSSIVVGPGVAIAPTGDELHLCAAVTVRLPVASVALQVEIRFAERFTGSIPVTVGEPEIMPASVKEGCEVILQPLGVDKRSPAASDSTALPLAHVVLRRNHWRIDRRFKVPRSG